MKIKEFSIIRYGPLPFTSVGQLYNFNLFWGKNEEGKTLTIDALVKLLLGKNNKEFEHIDRVNENPEGYVIIEDELGKEIKLPEKGNLTKVADLTPLECCNIFIARNSNLSIARDVVQENKFYTDVTDRLTGLRTGEIIKIKENLRDIGKVTVTGIFRDIKDEKLATRIGNAKSLTEKINNLSEDIKNERFDELEEKTAQLKEEIGVIEQKLKELDDARKREKYEKGRDALDNLKNSLKELKTLEIYNEKDERLWRDCERDIIACKEESNKTVAFLQENKIEFKKVSEKLIEVERDFQLLEEKKKTLDEGIRAQLKTYEDKKVELAKQQGKNKFFTLAMVLSAFLAGISLLGIIYKPSILFYILSALFLVLFAIAGIFKLQLVRNKSLLKGLLERNKLALYKLGMSAGSIEEIFFNIRKFDQEYDSKFDELQETKRKEKNLEEKIEELQNKKITEIQNKVRKLEEQIEVIKRKSSQDLLDEYSKKLRLKQQLERLIGEQRGILRSHSGEKGKNLEENVFYWDAEIANLAEYKHKAINIKYNESVKSELEEEKQKLKETLLKISESLKFIQKEMEEVERKANEILQLEGEYIYCETSVDMNAVKNKIQEFISENQRKKDNVMDAIQIFEIIEAEEKEKVSELFGKESPVSQYFNEITEGLYAEVSFSNEAGKTGRIEVKRRDGILLDAEQLSGGAYDQLYFSIRLALGEKLLKGKKGFFIMDDPFIKSDPNRLQKLIDMLKKITEAGWQVMYFSAKGETKEILKEDIASGIINYVALPGISA